jgi:hypothetical protein
MTKKQMVYADTLNLLGTGVNTRELQDTIDREHARADRRYRAILKARQAAEKVAAC